MRITRWTRTRDILPLLTKERLDELLEKVPVVKLRKNLLSMTVGEMAEIFSDEEAFVAGILRCRRAFKAFGRLKQYKSEIEAISGFMKRFDFPKTSEEEAAAKGVDFPGMGQRMLIDCVKWFNLKSMKEAEKVPFADWLVMWQSEAASALFQRKYSKIIEQKQKQQAKKKR